MPARTKIKPVIAVATALTLVGVAAAIVMVVPRTGPEPRYGGHRLTFWLEQFAFNKGSRAEATTAIRAIGTNAIPVLLTMLAAQDPPLERKFLKLTHRQSLFHLTTASQYHLMARNGFFVLGRIAQPALPALARLANDQDADIRQAAAYSYFDVMGGASGPLQRAPMR